MTADPATTERERRRWIRRGAWLLAALAGWTVLGYAIVPALLRAPLERELSARSGRAVAIERLRLDPFAFELRLEGLSVAAADPSAPPQFSAQSLVVDWQLRSLLGGGPHLARVELLAPRARIARDADGRLDLPEPPADPAQDGAASAAADAAPTPWSVDTLVVRDGVLALQDARLPAVALSAITVDGRGIGAREGLDNALSLSLRESRGGALAIEGTVDPAALGADVSVEIEGIEHTLLAPLLADALPGTKLEGLHAQLTGRLRRDATHPQGMLQDATLAIEGLELAPVEGDAPPLRLDTLRASGITLDLAARSARVAALDLAGGELGIRRAADGIDPLRWLLPATTPAEPPAEPPAVPPSAPTAGAADGTPDAALDAAAAAPVPDASAWRWSVDRVGIAGIRADFTDLTTDPPVAIPLRLDTLALAPLDPARTGESTLEATLAIGEQGKLAIAGTLAPFAGTFDLALDAEAIELLPAQPWLAGFARVALRDGRIGARLRVVRDAALRYEGALAVDDLHVVDAPRQRDFLTWRRVAVEGIAGDAAGVRIERIGADDAFTRLIIAADRSTNWGDLRVAPATDAGEPRPAFAVAIARVDVRESRLRFADFSLTPRFVTTIEQLGGSLTDIGTASSKAVVDLKGTVDAYAPVTVSGRFNPLNAREDTDVELAFRNVELASLTPYSARFAGFAIDRGKLSLDMRYTVARGRLQGANKVVLDQLTLGAPVDSPDAIDLPLRLAIALLTDRNGRIDLDIPVEGDLDDPEFRLGGVIVKAVLGLLGKIVTAPFALLGALAGGGADEAALSEVRFDPGSAAPGPDEAAKFDTLRRALADRPQLLLTVRGVADPASDRRALQDAALDTALAPSLADVADADRRAAERAALLSLHAARIGPPPAPPAAPAEGADAAAAARHEAALADWLGGVRDAVRASFTVDDERLLELAEARARAVQDSLLADGGVPPEQVFLSRSALDPAAAVEGQVRLALELGSR